MAIKKIISLGYGIYEPFLDILFSYDQKNKLKSLEVLSVCGVTAHRNSFNHYAQTNQNVFKIHLDGSPVNSDLKSFFSSLPDRKKSLSEFILLLKFISETKGCFFEPYIAQTNWYALTLAQDPDLAQDYLDLLNSYSYDFYIDLLRIATKTKPRGGTFSFMRQTSRLLEIEWAFRSLESRIVEVQKEIKILDSKVEENLKNFQTDLQSLHLKFQNKNK